MQSRIFQQMPIPDILKAVLKGLKVKWDIQGNFAPRDYCVQYRESDFNFASRLMEEEGIYYYFAHEAGGATMVIANTPAGHGDVPISKKVIYDDVRGGTREDPRITDWVKWQEVRSGQVTLWDHCFELPHQHLEAEKKLLDAVPVGKVTHKIQLNGVSDKLEVYDYPGGYAQRFDGIDPGGGDRASDLEKIFQDNKRTAEIRLQQEQAAALQIHGQGTAAQLTAGHKFTLERHPDADGDYVLTEVREMARLAANYRSGQGEALEYSNSFTCIPAALPYRPPRQADRPVIQGTQTAVVTGPAGEEIFCDKYGRVKVQFHWDRQGKYDANSSCWVRVSTIWAGKNWGVIHIPRIGQEVIVAFEEGDPDRPLIVGSVYNADCMPPGNLPAERMISGARTASYPGSAGFNGMVCNDTKGTELVSVHGQFDMNTVVEHDQTTTVHNNRTDVVDVDDSETVGGNQKQHVVKDQTVNIDANRTETVGANESITVGGNRTRSVSGSESVTVTKMRTHTVGINEAITVGAAQEVTVGGLQSITVGAIRSVSVGASQSITVGAGQTISVGGKQTESVAGNSTETVGGDFKQTVAGERSSSVGKDDKLKVAQKLLIDAGEEITLQTGDASITMKKDGTISIKGKDITLTGSGKITAKADSDMTLKGSKIGMN
jgi:type VI secretion system secreted protein VgrG